MAKMVAMSGPDYEEGPNSQVKLYLVRNVFFVIFVIILPSRKHFLYDIGMWLIMLSGHKRIEYPSNISFYENRRTKKYYLK